MANPLNVFRLFGDMDRSISETAREHNTSPNQVAAEYSGIFVHAALFTLFITSLLSGFDPLTFWQTKLITPASKVLVFVISLVIGLFTAYGYVKGSTQLTSVFFSTLSKRNSLESIAKNIIQILLWASITLLAVPYILMVGALAIRSSLNLSVELSSLQITGFIVFAFFMTGIFIIFPGLLRTPYTLEELQAITIYQIAESLPERLEAFAEKQPTAALHIAWRAVLPDHIDPFTDDMLATLSDKERQIIADARMKQIRMGVNREEGTVFLEPPRRKRN